MRLTRGCLKRRLPKAVPNELDRIICKTWHCDGTPDEFYVGDLAYRDGGELHRLSATYRRRKDAVAAAWRTMPLGGRLLDTQGGVLAEQPYLFALRFVRRLTEEEKPDFARGKKGERKLVRAIERWCGMPTRDARTWARTLIAHGWAEFPLTQSEIRHTRQPAQMRPAVAEVWALIASSPAEPLPEPLTR